MFVVCVCVFVAAGFSNSGFGVGDLCVAAATLTFVSGFLVLGIVASGLDFLCWGRRIRV